MADYGTGLFHRQMGPFVLQFVVHDCLYFIQRPQTMLVKNILDASDDDPLGTQLFRIGHKMPKTGIG